MARPEAGAQACAQVTRAQELTNPKLPPNPAVIKSQRNARQAVLKVLRERPFGLHPDDVDEVIAAAREAGELGRPLVQPTT